MNHWSYDSFFYHIYPLGFCGAPHRNDFSSQAERRLDKVLSWLDHIQDLGANALYLGPVFESSAHGYDTKDYFRVDRRLGDNSTLANLSHEIHRRGMRLVLDGVFSHVGRDFWAFQDVLHRGENSPYCGWFSNLRMGGTSPFGDPFSYEGWSGHYDLVRLNTSHPDVRSHLFEAVATWMNEYDIDGLRLDAADSLDLDFMRALSGFCHQLKQDFWLMGEVVHGDYRRWVAPGILDSVTNYESYKGLYSSHVDQNYFEIAYSFHRQFGKGGIYEGLPLYAFADNHDVDRVASRLGNPAYLYPLYCLLMSMPGVPSVYYGSEWGIEGQRTSSSDHALRPCLDLEYVSKHSANRDLAGVIKRLAAIRRSNRALRYGNYTQVHVDSQQFAFLRQWNEEIALVFVNSSDRAVIFQCRVPYADGVQFADALNPGDIFEVRAGKLTFQAWPFWGRILLRL